LTNVNLFFKLGKRFLGGKEVKRQGGEEERGFDKNILDLTPTPLRGRVARKSLVESIFIGDKSILTCGDSD